MFIRGEILAMASNPDYDPESWVGGISVAEYKPRSGSYVSLFLVYPPATDKKNASISDSNLFSVVSVTDMTEAPPSYL